MCVRGVELGGRGKGANIGSYVLRKNIDRHPLICKYIEQSPKTVPGELGGVVLEEGGGLGVAVQNLYHVPHSPLPPHCFNILWGVGVFVSVVGWGREGDARHTHKHCHHQRPRDKTTKNEKKKKTHRGLPSPKSPPPPAPRPPPPAPCGTSGVCVVWVVCVCYVCVLVGWGSGIYASSVPTHLHTMQCHIRKHTHTHIHAIARSPLYQSLSSMTTTDLEDELLEDLAVVDAGDVGLQLVVLVAVVCCCVVIDSPTGVYRVCSWMRVE